MYGLNRRRIDERLVHGTPPVYRGRTERDIEKLSREANMKSGSRNRNVHMPTLCDRRLPPRTQWEIPKTVPYTGQNSEFSNGDNSQTVRVTEMKLGRPIVPYEFYFWAPSRLPIPNGGEGVRGQRSNYHPKKMSLAVGNHVIYSHGSIDLLGHCPPPDPLRDM
jgi:hypothetical protein